MYASIPRSITGRLVALYALATCSILLAAGVFLSSMLDSHLTQGKAQFLFDEIDSLRAIQTTHPESIESLRDEVDLEAHSGRFLHYYVRILERGQRLIETSGMPPGLSEAAFAGLPRLSSGATPLSGTRRASVDGKTYLLVSADVSIGEHRRVLQLAIDSSSDVEVLRQYRLDMGLVVLFGTLISTLAGAFIARRGLAPLRAVTARIRGITAAQLDERVGSTRWPVELSTLAAAFDDMLSRLERSFQRLSQFSADLAHELRTPINNLMGEAEVALSRSRSDEDHRRVLESIREEFAHLSRIIDSLLFMARAENSETPIERRLLDARQEVQQVCDFYSDLADERGICVSVLGAGVVLADSVLLRRAISNLLGNAINHIPTGGHVEISVAASPAWLEIRVVDDGCGVAPEHLPRLFERFYRVDSARARINGSGLGLALVKSIVELHEGSVHIESSVGRGTCVSMCFPADAAAPNEAPQPLSLRDRAGQGRLKNA